MKSYSHVISKLFYEPAVITPMRHAALCQALEMRLAAINNPVNEQKKADRMDDDDDPDTQLTQVNKTAIIPVHGTLVCHPEDIAMSECGCAMEDLNAMIDMAENDSSVSRVIYDFRTPGGSVTGIPETARKILSSRKETIAYTGSECCSGGIWLASQCKRFYATQSSRVGSVGVYTLCLDATKAMKKEGVKINAIHAGKFKLLGAYWKEMTPEETAIVQKGVDKIYKEFKASMDSFRVVSDENYGNGLVFDGEDAAAIGFTDGCVESLDDILDDMI